MKKLNRFEYLQLASALFPEEEKKGKSFDILAFELFELAKAIQVQYEDRYRYEGENDSFDLLNAFEKNT